jgi:hypothetical protein
LTDATYKMMFPVDGDIIPITTKTTLKQKITISNRKTVTLNLTAALYASAANTNAIVVENGSTLNITGSADGSLNSVEDSGDADAATILVEEGGKVTLENASIINAGGVAVELNGANAQFELKSGAVTSSKSASPVAIEAKGGSSVTINNAESIITGGVTVNASSANINAKQIGALSILGEGASATVDVPTIGGVSVAAGTAQITAKALGTTVAVSGGKAEITADKETASTTNFAVSGSGKLTLKEGKIAGNVTVEGASATKQGTFVQEAGEITYSTTGSAAVAVTSFGVVDIQGGSIVNATSTASNTTDFALSLNGTSGKVAATISGSSQLISGASVISLTGASTNDVTLGISGTPTLITKASSNSGVVAIKVAASCDKAVVNLANGTLSDYKASAEATATTFESAIDLASGTLNITGAATLKGSKNGISSAAGTVNVSGAASIEGAKAAVDITGAGTLSVTGAATLKGANVIQATDASGNGATITLDAAEATYTVADGTTGYTNGATTVTDGFVLYNYATSLASNAAKMNKIEIKSGKFTGDVVCVKEHFISGGTFSKSYYLKEKQSSYLSEGYRLSYDEDQKFWEIVVESYNK